MDDRKDEVQAENPPSLAECKALAASWYDVTLSEAEKERIAQRIRAAALASRGASRLL